MMKRSSRYYLLHGIVISTVALICLISYAVTTSLTVANSKKQENLEYVSYEVLTDNVMPVSKEEQNTIENQNLIHRIDELLYLVHLDKQINLYYLQFVIYFA